ncbi:Sulfate permease [Planoprotostelium fungivorum]|uniref:Sulfate permease n=1 Tax=Planoprotostelium fungivorum TaxID=1890364 RepID=A0A2P6NLB4_9EUKA|nr:Sulfate permease [Planoprotostelium fungivorum]
MFMRFVGVLTAYNQNCGEYELSDISNSHSDDERDSVIPQDDRLLGESSYVETLHKFRRRPVNLSTRIKKAVLATLPHWSTRYDLRQWLVGDIIAGITVGVMAVPQGLAYSVIAGLPPINGLYASLIPLIVFAFLGTSRETAVGPFALTSIMASEAVSAIAEVGTSEYFGYTLLLTLLTGIVLTLMGIFRLGFLVNFMSNPVLEGFQFASAITIGTSQLKYLFGVNPKPSPTLYGSLYQFATQLTKIHWMTLVIGLGGVAFLHVNGLLAKRKIHLPAPLLLMIVGIISAWALNLESHGVRVVGDIPSGLPPFTDPVYWAFPLDDEKMEKCKHILFQSFVLALVSFMVTLSVAKKYAEERKYNLRTNQELAALGVSNIFTSLFGGFPIAGSLSRTVVNVSSGAKTQISSLFSALIVLLSLLFLTKVLYFLPMTFLASIVLVAVSGLANTSVILDIYRTKTSDLILWCVSFSSTLLLGVANGLVVSICASVAGVIWLSSRPEIVMLGRLPGSTTYRNVVRFPQALIIPGMIIVRMDASLFFANINFFKEKLLRMVHRNAISCIVMDWSSVSDMDYTACRVFGMVLKDLKNSSVLVLMAAVKGAVRDVLVKSKLAKEIGADNVLWELHDAVRKGAAMMKRRPKATVEEEDEEEEEEEQPLNIQHTFSPFVFENEEASPAQRRELKV